ncbi:MAG: response regulator [Burkholderiales bacterium]
MDGLSSLAQLNVFLIEPSKVQSQFVTKLLDEMGILHLTAFADGGSALAAMGKEAPDLVISSLYLPDMTGTDLVNAMRDDPALREAAFILISSETKHHYLDPIRQAGACAILPKPFQREQLRTALLTTLDFLNPNALKLSSEGVDIENLRVLVVDDSRTARAFIRHVLENLGIGNILEAENGRHAVEIIQENYFDLVFTDYNMPEMDGKELVEFIRKESWQSSVPVMMVSSERDENRLAAVQNTGVSAICDKPFEPKVVKELIERMLAQE